MAGRAPNGVSALDDASAALDDAYRGVAVKTGKGIDHAHAVADILRGAGCEQSVQVAGLLHDLVEDTPWTVADVRARFGDAVATLVAAVTEDDAITGYRRRKRALREQIERAGPAAIDIALADKIASLRYALDAGARVPRRKLAHYEATRAMAAGAAHPGVGEDVGRLLALVDARDRAAPPSRARGARGRD